MTLTDPTPKTRLDPLTIEALACSLRVVLGHEWETCDELADALAQRMRMENWWIVGRWDRIAGDGGPEVKVYCDGELVERAIAFRAGDEGLVAFHDFETSGTTRVYRRGRVTFEPT